MRRMFMLLCSLTLTLACSGGDDDEGAAPKVLVNPAPDGAPWETLGEWRLFRDGQKQLPAQRVEPYDVISPLWSDGTFKRRFIHVPEGKTIGYQADSGWDFPVGSVLAKTFSYRNDARDPSLGERLLETRLLVHEATGWVGHTYVWNDAQTDAVRKIAGDDIPVKFTDGAGVEHDIVYAVPNTNLCNECHGKDEPNTLGGVTRQLNRDRDYGGKSKNQIDHFASLGWFDSAPPAASARDAMVDPQGGDSVSDRARAYLDANCAHCHTAGRVAGSSGLLLAWADTANPPDPKTFGVCKIPTSAGGATCGLVHDVVPGKPDDSILICRVKSREPKVQMPPLATQLTDDTGVELLSAWVTSLTGACQ